MSQLQKRVAGFSGWIGYQGFDITPPVGIRLRNWGAQGEAYSTANSDELHGTVYTFQPSKDTPPLIVAGLDLGWWRVREDEWHFREPLVALAGGDESRVMVNLAHIHSGPSITREDGGLVPAYLDLVRDRLAKAAKEALARAEPNQMGFAIAHHHRAYCRDLWAGDRWVVGMDPAAPADDVLTTGVLWNDGGPSPAFACVALHPTTIGWQDTKVSGDYVTALRNSVEDDERASFLFLQGASGDLASELNYCKGEAYAANLGAHLSRIVDAASFRAWPRSHRFVDVVESGAPLGIWVEEPATFPANLKATKLSVPLELKPTEVIGDDPAVAERVSRHAMVRRWVGEGESFEMPIWVWQVGDSSWVGIPGEAYSHLQVQLRKDFPSRVVIVTNVTNGWTGYLPPEVTYGDDMYSVRQTPFAAGSLERVYTAIKAEIETHE